MVPVRFADAAGNLLRVDEGVLLSASSTRGFSPIGHECPYLFFAFFLGPLFFHGFRWLLFGFFACVLAFAHGLLLVLLVVRLFYGAVRRRMVANPGEKV